MIKHTTGYLIKAFEFIYLNFENTKVLFMFHTRRRKFHRSKREVFRDNPSRKRYPLPCENYVNRIKFNSKANEEAEKSYEGEKPIGVNDL